MMKDIFMAKSFHAYGTNYLRQEKSLRHNAKENQMERVPGDL